MMSLVQLAIILGVAVLLVGPTGRYLAYIYGRAEGGRLEAVFGPVEGLLYRAVGVEPDVSMRWALYARTLVLTNTAMAVLAFVLLKLQAWLPLNPLSAPTAGAPMVFNTVISFVTNTNWQVYAGETALSWFSQMAVITFLMFTSAASGLAAAAAFIRGLANNEEPGLGNFYRDFVRSITRLLVPLSLVLALVLVVEGVPQTLVSPLRAKTLDGSTQVIPRGPVASLESIKHLGTNGGGYYNAGSAHPFENPTPLTNALLILAMLLIPAGLVEAFGRMVGSKRQGRALLVAMALMFALALGLVVMFEQQGTPVLRKAGADTAASAFQSGGNMEGKEVRFGVVGSSLFATTTNAATTGSVNSSHDSFTPLGGGVLVTEMLLNAIFGADGVGLMNMLVFVIFAVFIAGLLVGRTPEFLGKKIESKEIKLASLIILVHPLLVLGATGIAVLVPAARAGLGNAGPHGLTEILYAYASASANNGSAFAGLKSATPFYAVSTAVVIFIGRYVPLVIQLGVAGSLAAKRKVPVTSGTMRTDTPLFVGVLLGIIVLVGLLTFFGPLALGPIAEHLAMVRGGLF